MTALTQYIPHLIVGLLALALLLFLAAIQQLMRGRSAAYWRQRRTAGQRGGQFFLMSVSLAGLALLIAFFSGFASVALRGVGSLFTAPTPADTALDTTALTTPNADATPEAATLSALLNTPLARITPATSTPTAPPTATAAPSQTPPPTASATPLPSPTPTVTDTPPPSPTPSATFETALNLYTPPNARPASADAEIRLLAADAGVSAGGTPLDPQTEFEAGIERIYLFFSYRDMANGVAWSRILYRDGAPLQGSTLVWSLGTEGSSYFFFGSTDGYPPGEYRVVFLLGENVVSEFPFSIS